MTDMVSVPSSFKVCSYNLLVDSFVKYGKKSLYAADHAKGWESRRKTWLVERISQLDADIVCLQEVQNFEKLDSLMRERGYAGEYAGRNNGQDEGVAIFYRRDVFVLSNHEPFFFYDGSGRLVQRMKLQRGSGSPFFIFNTHIAYPHAEKEKQMALSGLILQGHAGHPMIVCGDFNLDPTRSFIRNLMGCAGLVDPHRGCHKHSFTKCEGADPHPDGYRARIDFTFHSRHFRASHADVFGDIRDLPTAKEPSDHLPITVKVEVEDSFVVPTLGISEQLKMLQDALDSGKKEDILVAFFLLPENIQRSLEFRFWLWEGMPQGDPRFGRSFLYNNPFHGTIKEVVALFQANRAQRVPEEVRIDCIAFQETLKLRDREEILSKFLFLSAPAQRLIKRSLWVACGQPNVPDFARDRIRENALDPKLVQVVDELVGIFS